MNKTTLYILIALLIGWIILGSYLCKKYLCGISGAITETTEQVEEVKEVKQAASTHLLSLADGDKFQAQANEHFNFVHSAYSYLPLGAGLTGFLDKTATYLKGNPDRSINVTGIYNSEENNNSILPTLGLARANQLKQLLVERGVDSKRILTADLLTENNLAEGDTLFRGINFAFSDYELAAEERIPRIKSEIVGKPLAIYFPTGKNQVNLDAEQRKLFSDIIYYLDNVSGSNLSVTGYTDNTGNIEGNTRLSRKRAEFVRDYLAANGISVSRMNSIGRGPENPVATNDTREGRALNRRVEVVLN